MPRALLIVVLSFLVAPLSAQENDCGAAATALNQTLGDWIRVQIRVSRAAWIEQRLRILGDERAQAAAEVARLETGSFTPADVAELEDVNPAAAERERRESERLLPLINEARRRIVVLDQQIAGAEKELAVIFRELDAIERELPPSRAIAKPH